MTCDRSTALCTKVHRAVKMVNGFRYYRSLESVSIASTLSTALTIYPCQIRVHQRWQSKLQLPTARKKEWRPATADSSPHAVTCQHCDRQYFSRPRTRNLPIVCWLLVRRIVREYVFYVFLKIQKRDFLRFLKCHVKKRKKRRERCPSFHFLHFEIANEHFHCKIITHIIHMSCYTYNIILKLFIFC